MKMKRDGTIYLAHVQYRTGDKGWELVSWSIPVGMSAFSGDPQWVNQTGFALREPVFLEWASLDDVITKVFE